MKTEERKLFVPIGLQEPSDERDIPINLLEPVYQKLKAACERDRKRSLKFHLELGKIVSSGVKHVEKSLGSQRISHARIYAQLEFALGLPDRMLRNAHRVYTSFTDHDVAEFCKHDFVTWSHVVTLLALRGEEQQEVQQQMIAKRLSVLELTDEIRERKGAGKQTSGRPLAVPSNPRRALNDIVDTTSKLLRKEDEVWFGSEFDLEQEIHEMPIDKLSKELGEMASNAADHFEQVARAASQRSETLRALEDLIRQRLEANAEEQAALAAD